MIAPIESVTIENFRGIRRLTLTLHPRITVFFGANAAGKTTILDAIAIGLGGFVARLPKVSGRGFAKSGDLRVPWRERPHVSEKLGVARPFSRVHLGAAGGLRWDVTLWRSASDRAVEEGGVGTRDLYSALDPVLRAALDAEPSAEAAPLPLVAAYGSERSVVEVPRRERDFAREIRRFDAFDESLRASARFKSVFEWFRVSEDEERRERERRKDFSFCLPDLEWVRRAVARAELRCSHPRVETKPIRMLVDFEHDTGGSEMLDIGSLSDGYRTHFALVVDVARRMVQLNPSSDLGDPVRGTNSEAIILIDEVDLHLDPQWQARVIRGLLTAFPRAQFIVTTHSEQVIGSVEAESVRRLVWGDGEIAIEPVPFAQGATGERILIDLMGAAERVDGPVTAALRAYTQLVDGGQGTSPDALRLRELLDATLPGDSLLHRADLEITRRDVLARMGRR